MFTSTKPPATAPGKPARTYAKKAAIAAAAAAALLLSACGGKAGGDAGSADGLDTVTVQLDYQLRGDHGIFHVADKLGYFKQQGIDVEAIKTGTGSSNALRLVGTGRADFGFADLPSLVTARSQNIPVKALAVVNQHSPLAMCSVKKDVELKSIDDLKGLTAGIHPAGSTFIFYQALLSANGMERKDLREVTVTPPYENYLIKGKVDTVPCYIDAEVPQLEDAAGGEGSLDVMLGSDHGYKVYGSGLFTSDEMVKDDPDLVQRFTNAYLRAFRYVIDNPEKTAKILADSSPEYRDQAGLFQRQLQADIDHTFTSDATEKNGLGAMDAQVWQATIDTLADQQVLKGSPPAVEDIYTPVFVEKSSK
ncbi:ABC transporter substrate-binding protein [Streptomyces sp. NPDC001508]|uniref:ABC transporter substrate-binding protein n=1 Tax=Streptomyces sp. NPDC001508 TaxID=3154656 RepID=UPI00331E83B2